ncbi:TonB-dependent hemoglobin/transferrin/lactoferrin family receptor [Allopusillimonas soli]|uniref:TonB-dependent hemoglobin/transferrin/lactoferrin family receptor n=1 Tax=Allopusillimonas soli TaxID=659016 RepID=A0A853FEB0_9BURK|nr:TonB-dependent hemoglobin/transferrin/lactoferrin family receptor [Allopusillimonas soli]NYT38403.1 TonB-dependent hemoglobin/transferrin/lactoferrin family receptor [Allopusillimonas soli]TEA72035.1 TonB-dependent hemoglobin/transferrin/lactoferrin family receptor [Allopusillimonas soli]
MMSPSVLSSPRKRLALLALAGMPLIAVANIESPVNQLDTITVQGQVPIRPDDVTGVARIEKTADDLDKEQVMGIRDLLRYDPGISVNESGGRGTSTGFSMRGVDKERVAVTIDGMAQGQTLTRQHAGPWGKGQGRGSGAKNEVEYENLKLVDISQGANSVLAGSGALGGAVMMQTKDPADFLHDGKPFGAHNKIGYTSKDGRWMRSLGMGFRFSDMEGMMQYTTRAGHEIRPHRAVYDSSIDIVRYDTDASGLVTESLSARDISGPERQAPNPMTYRSASWLTKLNYAFTPAHVAGIVHEHTRQRYDLRDFFERNYWSLHAHESDNNIFMTSGNIQALAYTPTRFVYDRHRYDRTGLEYRFLPAKGATWLDSMRVRLDRQAITTNSHVHNLLCAPYPKADPECRPAPLATGTRMYLSDTRFTQKLHRFDLMATKSFTAWRKHALWVHAGIEHGKAVVADRDRSAHAYREYNHVDGRVHDLYSNSELAYITPPIQSRHVFLAVNDAIRLSNTWRLGAGLRYDRHTLNGIPGIFDETASTASPYSDLPRSRYNNLSWDIGLTHHLTPHIDLAYKSTSGFRVPSVGERLGPGFNRRMMRPSQPELKAETSRNHEIGLHMDTRYGTLSASYFHAQYANLIDVGMPSPESGLPQTPLFHNLQSVKTKGVGVKGAINLHEAWQRMPDGMQAMFALSYIRPRGDAPSNTDFIGAASYALDMLQPLRVVYGLEYNHPSSNWGAAIKTTYSAAKKTDELLRNAVTGGLITRHDSTASFGTPKWIVTDLSGYYRFNRYVTLRAAVHNVFDYRYITWESARQAERSVMNNNLSEVNPLALAAPGRNYAVNLEIKY